MARTYARNHPIMKNGHDCNETFPNGITNGAFWYELNGELIQSIFSRMSFKIPNVSS
jgi:hypothetical protein